MNEQRDGELLQAQIPSAWDISDPSKPCDVTVTQALRAIAQARIEEREAVLS